MKVLIIEDDSQVRVAFARILGGAGFDVVVAGDAVAAVSTAVRERPDLIILDLGLPAGDGTLVLERLRNLPLTSVTPAIVVTGGMPNLDRLQRLAELDCETILHKPVAAEQLLDATRRSLGIVPASIESVEQR